jgi:hypothetical protein
MAIASFWGGVSLFLFFEGRLKQGLKYAREALYQLSHTPGLALLFVFCFWDRVSNFVWAGLYLVFQVPGIRVAGITDVHHHAQQWRTVFSLSSLA